MTVLDELLAWSQDRPAWQRDALRRLVLHGELSEDDIRIVTDVCKSAHGLAEPQDALPLGREHLPKTVANSAAVSLVSIFHRRGVNALAEDQRLNLASALTVVYGDNAAGKTGYIRILKSACRARGQEQILGNVVAGMAPPSVEVSIKYKVGAEPEPREWAGGGEDAFIARVSVFDTQCAAVYLTEKTDVAFRPFGLDLFDKLVQACRGVRARLESEQCALAASPLTALLPQFPSGTAVAKFLASINSLTPPEAVHELANLSGEEHEQLALLEKSLLDLQVNDPEKLMRTLTLRAGRFKALTRHLKEVEATLSAEAVTGAFDARAEVRRKSKEAKRIRDATLPVGVLAGTGSEPWKELWEAARRFSQEQAYQSQAFPVVDDGAHCVLCQRGLDDASALRFRQFEAFVVSTAERELRQVAETFARMRSQLLAVNTTTEAVEEMLKEVRLENEALADAVSAALAANEKRREAVALALTEDRELALDCPPVAAGAIEFEALVRQTEARVESLRASAGADTRALMTIKADELRARKLLSQHMPVVMSEIDRKKRLAAYGLCMNETTTNAITQKSTAVTKSYVTQKLKDSFRNELDSLGFRHIEVELKEAGGSEGILYHKLLLTRAPGVDLPRVVSEGEQRCLSIAAFFAELSTADEPSGIVFDDPMSSLDYRWREGVARRLVHEAKTRQVIVFTHDVVFLLLLKQFAEAEGVNQLDQHVRQLSKGAGVCAEELPWVAMPIRKKIGHLKKEWQAADKLFRDGEQATYEKEATYLYGLLREAWERALEEVLLAGTVERFRFGVQTQQISKIADITAEDCRILDTAMGKCSKWLPGHDQAPAARAPVPEPVELKADIEALESWVGAIRGRR